MSTADPTLDLLAYHAFPHLASALRVRKDAILREWEKSVACTLPAADALTLRNLRDSVPLILEEVIEAFSSSHPVTTQALVEGSRLHGESRFQENYNIRELVVEYQLLRRVMIEQISEELNGELDETSNVALNMAVDAALQSGTVIFVENLQRQLKSATEIQSKYLSFLSHDLRNHLSQITLYIQILAMKLAKIPELADSVADLKSVRSIILKTTAGMDRLLQSEQLRKGYFHLAMEVVDLNSLLSEAVRQITPEAQLKGIELRIDVPDGAKVISEEALLVPILQNLLGNAVKYSSGGRIEVTARHNVSRENSAWILSVSDQGPGIAPENLTHLFDAFQRADTYGKPGVGLGLSIASEATRLLGGKLEVESVVGIGSSFRLLLPCQILEDEVSDQGT
jgi:signal transduction histidine kinase